MSDLIKLPEPKILWLYNGIQFDWTLDYVAKYAMHIGLENGYVVIYGRNKPTMCRIMFPRTDLFNKNKLFCQLVCYNKDKILGKSRRMIIELPSRWLSSTKEKLTPPKINIVAPRSSRRTKTKTLRYSTPNSVPNSAPNSVTELDQTIIPSTEKFPNLMYSDDYQDPTVNLIERPMDPRSFNVPSYSNQQDNPDYLDYSNRRSGKILDPEYGQPSGQVGEQLRELPGSLDRRLDGHLGCQPEEPTIPTYEHQFGSYNMSNEYRSLHGLHQEKPSIAQENSSIAQGMTMRNDYHGYPIDGYVEESSLNMDKVALLSVEIMDMLNVDHWHTYIYRIRAKELREMVIENIGEFVNLTDISNFINTSVSRIYVISQILCEKFAEYLLKQLKLNLPKDERHYGKNYNQTLEIIRKVIKYCRSILGNFICRKVEGALMPFDKINSLNHLSYSEDKRMDIDKVIRILENVRDCLLNTIKISSVIRKGWSQHKTSIKSYQWCYYHMKTGCRYRKCNYAHSPRDILAKPHEKSEILTKRKRAWGKTNAAESSSEHDYSHNKRSRE